MAPLSINRFAVVAGSQMKNNSAPLEMFFNVSEAHPFIIRFLLLYGAFGNLCIERLKPSLALPDCIT